MNVVALALPKREAACPDISLPILGPIANNCSFPFTIFNPPHNLVSSGPQRCLHIRPENGTPIHDAIGRQTVGQPSSVTLQPRQLKIDKNCKSTSKTPLHAVLSLPTTIAPRVPLAPSAPPASNRNIKVSNFESRRRNGGV